MKLKFTHDDLAAMGPCQEAMDWCRQFKTLAGAWEKCNRADWMIWFLTQKKLLDKQIAVKFAILCARRVLKIYEKKYPGDLRPRQAIEAAERYLAKPTRKNRNAARAAAKAVFVAADAAFTATYAAYAAVDAIDAAVDADYAAAYIDYTPDTAKERAWQASQLRKLVPNPFD